MPVMEGWLFKADPSGKNWNRRCGCEVCSALGPASADAEEISLGSPTTAAHGHTLVLARGCCAGGVR